MKSHGDTPTRQSEVLHNAISSGHTEPGAEHSPSQPPTRPETAASSHDTVVGSDSFGTRYEIAERLGAGGMGAVYKAFDRELKRTVAIKRIRPELLARPHARQRFDQEAQAVATLNHPNIVQIFDRGTDAHGPFLVMEFIGGPSLADRLASGKPLELDDTVRIVSALCDALQAAHDKGVLHRDVKPANVLFSEDGTPKLTDFGLARVESGQEVTRVGAVFGTPEYMSPEQKLDASKITPRSDQFSLAATLDHMTTGEVPSRILESRMPEILRDVVVRGTEPNVDARYPTITHFKEALALAWSKPSSNRFVEENMSSNAFETLKRQQEKIRQTNELARRLAYEQHDWGQAKQVLETIPADVRDLVMFAEISRNAEIVSGLSESIARAVGALQWFGLNVAIDKLAELQPHRTELTAMSKLIDPSCLVNEEHLETMTSTDNDKLLELHPALATTKPFSVIHQRHQESQNVLREKSRIRDKFLEVLAMKSADCGIAQLDTIALYMRVTNPSELDVRANRKYDAIVNNILQCRRQLQSYDPLDRSINTLDEGQKNTVLTRLHTLLPENCIIETPRASAKGCLGIIAISFIIILCIGTMHSIHQESVLEYNKLRSNYPNYGFVLRPEKQKEKDNAETEFELNESWRRSVCQSLAVVLVVSMCILISCMLYALWRSHRRRTLLRRRYPNQFGQIQNEAELIKIRWWI